MTSRGSYLIEKAEGSPNCVSSEITIDSDSSVLDIAVPDTSLEYPPSSDDADDWLTRLSAVDEQETSLFRYGGRARAHSYPSTLRKSAFPDEQLRFFLIARNEDPTANEEIDEDHPPASIYRAPSSFR